MAGTNDDLELKDLNQYYGSEKYTRVMGVNCTDGIMYVFNNGYGWLITDSIVMLKAKCSTQEFCAVKLRLLPEHKATMRITDGNENTLHSQSYEYTDAKVELTLYYTDGVLLLEGEY